MDDLNLAFNLAKYIYNGGITGIVFWILYDIHILKKRAEKAMEKKDVSELIHSELALVKQEQAHIKIQLDRIENKIDDMRGDFYLPPSRRDAK